ncbi:MAG: tetratricopeptide repeat protein [Elusimicrobia bacterium]|nr:tetratricopeptide repeat protein [Elusimicrobiota bacterium]
MIFSWLQVVFFLAAMTAGAWLLYPDEYTRGKMYRDEGDRSESIKLYRSYLARHPGHKGATLGLAASCEAAGVPEEAIEPLLEFYRLRRGDLEAARAAITLLERSQQLARAEDFRWELIEDLRVQPPAGRKRLEEVLYEALQRAVASQDDERALRAMAILAAQSEDGPSYREQMIRLLLSRRLLERALAVLREDLRAAPKNVDLRRTVSRVHRARGDAAAALREVETGLVLLPRNPGLIAERADIHLDAKRWDKAEPDLRLLMKLEPQEEGWTRELARVLIERGRFEEGVAVYDALLAKDPADRRRWWDLVYVYSDRRRHEEAAARLERLLARFPGDLEALDALVSERQAAGRVDLAITLLQRRAKTAPRDAERRATLAALLIEEERLAEAVVQVEAVLALAPDDPKTWLEAATLRETLNDHRGAASLYERYLERFPDDSKSLEKLAGLYVELGERRKAIELLRGYFRPPPRAGAAPR